MFDVVNPYTREVEFEGLPAEVSYRLHLYEHPFLAQGGMGFMHSKNQRPYAVYNV